MLNHEIILGKKATTKPDRNGLSVSGRILSKGTKNAKVQDIASNLTYTVPFTMIEVIEDLDPAQAATVTVVPYATEDDIITVRSGVKYRVTKVNQSRYQAVRLSDGVLYTVGFESVVEVVSGKQARIEWFISKGFTAKDATEFDKAFGF